MQTRPKQPRSEEGGDKLRKEQKISEADEDAASETGHGADDDFFEQ